MKIVIQKVKSGKVSYKDDIIREIGEGNIFYIGFEVDDTSENIIKCTDWIINYISESGKEALLLSQFTLFAQFKGQKPSFHKAKNNNEAKEIFFNLVERVKKETKNNVKSGLFGEYLDIIYSSDNLETFYKDFNN